MTAPSQPFDLKAVGKLFNDTLAIMRDETPSLDTLEPQAIEWLKRARHKLMRDIEAECVLTDAFCSYFLSSFHT
jgi:hypothetical protein